MPRDDSESGIGSRRRARGARPGRRGRDAAAAAGPDRIPGGGAPCLRDRGAPAHAVPEFRPDGFHLRAWRRDPRRRHGRARAVQPPSGGACQAGDRQRLPRPCKQDS